MPRPHRRTSLRFAAGIVIGFVAIGCRGMDPEAIGTDPLPTTSHRPHPPMHAANTPSPARLVPPIDAAAPAVFATATFALG